MTATYDPVISGIVSHSDFIPPKLSSQIENSTRLEIDFFREVLQTNDPITQFTPSYYGVKNINGNEYCEMENLLDNFENPAVMDIKVLSFQISF